MSHLSANNLKSPFRITLSLALVVMFLPLASCRKSEKAAASKQNQLTFSSPDDAGAALREAANSGDQAKLLEIFGPDGKEALFSEEATTDQNSLKEFVTAYDTMNRLGKIDAGGVMLYVGTQNYPFPIPLQQNSSGQWYFNTAAGLDEIQARRIGKDELTAMAAIHALADAQQQYFNQNHEYAQKFVSDEGQHNGLFWPVPQGQPASPLAQMGDFAEGAGYTRPGAEQPFNGYYFRILTKQGETAKENPKDYVANGKMADGFAILAYPAEYRNTGIMTFMIGKDGVVYARDLGQNTVNAAKAMTEFSPGHGWQTETE